MSPGWKVRWSPKSLQIKFLGSLNISCKSIFTNKTTPSLTVEIVYSSVGKIWRRQNKRGLGVVGWGKGVGVGGVDERGAFKGGAAGLLSHLVTRGGDGLDSEWAYVLMSARPDGHGFMASGGWNDWAGQYIYIISCGMRLYINLPQCQNHQINIVEFTLIPPKQLWLVEAWTQDLKAGTHWPNRWKSEAFGATRTRSGICLVCSAAWKLSAGPKWRIKGQRWPKYTARERHVRDTDWRLEWIANSTECHYLYHQPGSPQ